MRDRSKASKSRQLSNNLQHRVPADAGASVVIDPLQKFAVASTARNPTSALVTAPTSSPSECSVWRGDPGSLQA